MTKRQNLFPKLMKPREMNFLKAAGIIFLLSCVMSQYAVADTNDKHAVAITEQITKVSGTVLDEKGESVIGATVKVKGSTSGTITDLDGKFSIDAKLGSTIEISYVGYVTQSVKAESAPIKVILKEDSETLDEVIVVGYGTTTKRSMISSVSTVDAKQMEALPVSNMTQGLAGRSRGLIVVGNGGGINKVQNISIRGGAQPLVVIDGVIREYNDFVTLAPEDVDALAILKDASATAVYGARATNGILQVTTKRGKTGKPVVSYSFNQSWSQPGIWADKLDVWDRAEYANIGRTNDGLDVMYSPETIQIMRDGSDLKNYGNTDWRKLVLNDWAPQTKHNVQMTGGTEANSYFISLGHIDQNSLYKNDNHNMQRTNFRLSQSSTVKSIGLKTTATLDGFIEDSTHPLTSTSSSYYEVFGHIQNRSPLLPGVNKYGLPYNVGDNPVGETAADTGYKRRNTKNFNGNLSVEWEVPWVSGLKLRANGNYRYAVETGKDWRKDPALYNWDSKDPVAVATPSLSHFTKTAYSYNLQYFAEYTKAFGKHGLSVLGGFEATYGESDEYGEGRTGFNFPIDQMFVGPAATQTNYGSEGEAGRAGWIGQLKYNYDNRYFVEASIRYDGSDNFPKNKRWGAFYSGSLGWTVSDEAFMETLRDKHVLDLLKVRASYGQVGLDNWGDNNNPYYLSRFEYLSSYGYNTKGAVIGGGYVPTFSEGAIPSPDITWFTTDQFNFGFDFGSMNNRLYGSFDYFYYSTSGFLYAPDPLKLGYTAPLGQSLPRISSDGELRRGGFEFQLGWKDRIGDFTYDIAANFTKYTEFWNRQPTEAATTLMNPYIRSTQEYGYYGTMLTNLGYYKDANDVYNSVKRESSYNLTGGDIKYKDVNGDGKIDSNDNLRLGRANKPRANYGINLALGYKGWSLNVLFQGAPAFDMYAGDALRMSSGQAEGGMSVIYDFQRDVWTPENTNARFPRLMSAPGLNENNNYQVSDFWLINGAYIRLKDFNLTYDFKHSLLKGVSWLSKANVGFSGQNIFTISDVVKYGLDPENSSMENYGYPNERVFAISVNLGF